MNVSESIIRSVAKNQSSTHALFTLIMIDLGKRAMLEPSVRSMVGVKYGSYGLGVVNGTIQVDGFIGHAENEN